jgi:N-acetylgalactosamine kinase
MIFTSTDPDVLTLIPEFERHFQSPPTSAGSAPGRVNLIGEHIDYCGFAVFPMALSGKHTTVLIRPTTTNLLRCRNTDPTHYPDSDIPFTSPHIPLDGPLIWVRYVNSVVTVYCQTANFALSGLDILVDGKVPIASGLSSSASLLCAIAIALDSQQGIPHEKQWLVDLTVQAEHNAGMNCGGMDQAIAIFAQEGFACVIGFDPPSVKPVRLPDAHFVVAHCMQRAAKVEGQNEHCYNHRVLEVRRAAELMDNEAKTIGDIVKKVGFQRALEIAQGIPEREGRLVLRDRAVHVVSEAGRVLQMEGASIDEWGVLMGQSHESCRKFYQCSCEALDELVADGMEAGATGGRLTGAGWGGCAIFLLKVEKNPDEFIAALKESYYKKHNVEEPIIFATKPGPGAIGFRF